VTLSLLSVVALVLVLGVASRVAADRLKVPSVLFLIVAGVVIGPEVLGFVSRESFGGGLSTMVGVAVGIILFEGSFKLRVGRLRESPADILRLCTVGALVMWLGTALAVRAFIAPEGTPVEWEVALLIGALLVATGPTVISPILNVVTVRDHVSATMESEGIINDLTAAALAVVVFEVLILGSGGVGAFFGEFLLRIGVGVGVGLAVAGAVWRLLRTVDIAPQDAPLHSRLIVLAGIIAAFALAEVIAGESGIAAAATMGFVLGNVDMPHERDVEGFVDDLTTLVLAFVFVALAALIDFGDILALGVAGIAVVAAVTLVVRPFLIFLSIRNERFTTGERLFLSAVAPRGIIPASVATLFAIELRETGAVAEAEVLTGTVFSIIFVTVVFQAGFARQIAERLEVVPMRTLIIGGGRVGNALALRLERDGENVVVVEADEAVARRLRQNGLEVVTGDGTDVDILREAGTNRVETVIATTDDDDSNLLACQLAKTKLDVDLVAARVNQPENVDAFETLGVRAIDAALSMANSLEDAIERPSLSRWMDDLDRAGDVQEITVTATDLAGRTIAEVNSAIPENCLVALVSHTDGETVAPAGDHVLEEGDAVTFIGEQTAVDRAVKRFHPHD